MSDTYQIPDWMLERCPHLPAVHLALAQEKAGENITARCPKCNEVIQVTKIELTDSWRMWVMCPNKCFIVHFNGG